MGVVGDDSGCDDVIVISQRPYDVFRFPLSTGVLSELKMMTSFFIKSAEKSKSYSCPIGKGIDLLRFGYAWAFSDAGGNVERDKCIESFGWITELSGRRTWGPEVVGFSLFKVMVSLS